MDPILIYGAVTAHNQTRQQHTTIRPTSPNSASSSTRSWRPGAAKVLRRMADRLEPATTWSSTPRRSVPAT
jgi:hypothetical protein